MRRPHTLPAAGEPFSTINTTPMIDVMLVLLIIMILSLPAPTHKVAVDLPNDKGLNSAPPPVHRLSIAATGAYAWDGAPVSSPQLAARLAVFKADPAGPVLHLQTDPEAPYERFDETMVLVKKAGIEKVGFVGNPPGF